MKMTKNNLIKKMKREREKRDVAAAKASSAKLAPVPRASWPHHADPFRVEVWLSSGFHASFTEGSGAFPRVRRSPCDGQGRPRTGFPGTNSWK